MILDQILGWFSKDVGIDLGTANTLVWVRGEGIVLDEPSVVALNQQTKKVLEDRRLGPAVGRVAKEMFEKTPDGIEAIRPLQNGVIADFDVTEVMLKTFISRVHNNRKYAVYPRVVIAVPSGITPVERRAVYNCTERSGARKVYVISEALAAGIGAGLPIQDPVANMVVDIGGGTSEIAVISMAKIAASVSLRVAGDELDQAIVRYLKDHRDLIVGERTAERVKIEIGSAWPLTEVEGEGHELALPVGGRGATTGLPTEIEVRSEDIREALQEPLGQIVAGIKHTLEKTKPELSADLVERGIVLCGGGALLRGIDRLISHETGLPVTVAEDPLRAVARGTGAFLENLDVYNAYMEAA